MNMIYFFTFITTVALYTIASCMDGPDLKPRWKKWLGGKFERMANKYYPINYVCEIRYKTRWKTREVPAYMPPIDVINYDVKKIEKTFLLNENELFEARMQEEWARQGGRMMVPFLTVDGIVARCKESCVKSVLDAVKPFITIEEDRENHYPGIMIRGYIHVGIRKDMI